MFKKIAFAILGIVLIFVVIVAFQPADFQIARSQVILAPADVIYAQINDFRQWSNWSPWDKMDPGMKKSYEGALTGPGAIYLWNGNSKVGEGKMTILQSEAGQLVKIQLDFQKPMTATNICEFTLKPEGTGTSVTWKMTGKNGFISKAFGLLLDMDKLVGGDFEKGLAALKAVTEESQKRL